MRRADGEDPSPVARLSWAQVAAAGVLWILFAGSLEPRLGELTRPFWEDEIHHNYETFY